MDSESGQAKSCADDRHCCSLRTAACHSFEHTRAFLYNNIAFTDADGWLQILWQTRICVHEIYKFFEKSTAMVLRYHLEDKYGIRFEAPCSTLEEIETALRDITGPASELIINKMREFLRWPMSTIHDPSSYQYQNQNFLNERYFLHKACSTGTLLTP